MKQPTFKNYQIIHDLQQATTLITRITSSKSDIEDYCDNCGSPTRPMERLNRNTVSKNQAFHKLPHLSNYLHILMPHLTQSRRT